MSVRLEAPERAVIVDEALATVPWERWRYVSTNAMRYVARHRLTMRQRDYDSPATAQADVNAVVRVFAEKQKARQVGYATEDLTFYSIRVLDVMVEAIMSGTRVTGDDGGKSEASDPAEGGNLVAMLADVRRAMAHLVPRADRDALYRWHAGTGGRAEYDRGLTALQLALGGARPRGLR